MANEFYNNRCAKATYDFDVLAGAQADAVGLSETVPAGAIVTRVITSTLDAFTSGGSATVAINIGSTEVLVATAFDNAAFVGVDVAYSTPVAASGEINLDIAGADLTAGKYDVYVEYLV